MIKFIDLFSGIGGFRIALESLGAKCVFSNDLDQNAFKTYQKNFSYENHVKEDIRKIKSKDIPNHDILCAGFPCQPFSVAGYRKGLKDNRGKLFFEIVRIIKDKQPKSFLLENVKGILSSDKGIFFKQIIKSLEKLGYNVSYEVLNSKYYGNTPQIRERVYIIGLKNNSNFLFPKPIKQTKKIKDILFKEKQDKIFYYDKYSIFPLLKKTIKKTDTIYQWRRKYVRENKSNSCPTLVANMGTGGHNVPLIRDKYGIRKLTPRECARFQGFPDNFILPNIANSHLYKQIGNSVSVPVVQRIAKEIKKCLNGQ